MLDRIEALTQTGAAGSGSKRWLIVEALAWCFGGALLSFYLAVSAHAALMARADVDRFQRYASDGQEIDQSLWSDSRKAAYEESLDTEMGLPEALLAIPRLDLEVPVWEGVDDITLNRAVGRVPHTRAPGEPGNMVLAGHRDGFFRELGELEVNDRIEIQTLRRSHVYRVAETLIVDPEDVRLMDPTPETMITLITCYPFYYLGPAPKRYVVRAIKDDFSNQGD